MLTSSDTSQSTLKQFWKHNGPEKSRIHISNRDNGENKILALVNQHRYRKADGEGKKRSP